MRNILWLFVSLFTFFSCSIEIEGDEDRLLIGNDFANHDEIELRREISLLMGSVLLDKEAANLALDYARFKNDNSESISLAALAGNESKIPMEERVALGKARKLNAVAEPSSKGFKSALITSYHAMNGQLPIMQQIMRNQSLSLEGASASSDNSFFSILDTDAFADYELYFPYEEEFNWKNVDTFAMSWAPENLERGSSDAHLFKRTTGTYDDDQIIVDDDYAYKNPTIVLMPTPKTELIPIGIEDDEDYADGGDDIYVDPEQQYWLTQNVDHTQISQNDVLRTIIPKIRLTKHYSGWPSKSKIVLYRVSGDLNLNADGNINSTSSTPYLLRDIFKFKRSNIKDKEWKTVNITFDGDWDMHETNQQIVLFAYRYSGYGTSTAEGTVSIGYDEETKQFVHEARITAPFSISRNKTRLKYNNSISRRDALSHIVGNFGAGTKSDGGVSYTVRTADALEYYFKHHYTDVPE
ncbi:MAG: hypothetical protein P8N93_05230 [Flavobacteriaceae bacterium]|nr:hypothetical protein [Flavobacteriaceae bacterium]